MISRFIIVKFQMRASSFSSYSAPWPDVNSPVLSKIDFGVPLVELFKWLDIRDTFIGENKKEQDITRALTLARDCKHPDAEWLTSLFKGKDVSTKEQAREVLLLHQNDALALCFAWHLNNFRWRDLSPLRCAAEMGNAFACSLVSADAWCEDDFVQAFRFAQQAAETHERDGYAWLATCYSRGDGCEMNLHLAKENYLIAAELGYTWAASSYADCLEVSDPERWMWWGRAALHGESRYFRLYFPGQVEQFFSGSGNATIVFLIGRTLKGNIDMEKKLMFLSPYHFDSSIGPAKQAVSFYEDQIKSARLAVDTWTLVATRLHVIKDMRIFIGKMIWEARFEANYKVSARALRAQKRSRK